MQKQALRGFSFTGSGTVIAFLVEVVSVAILARILTPADFGLFATAMVIQLLLVITINGTADTIIQRTEITEVEKGTVLVILVSASLCAYGIMFMAAPWIAEFLTLPGLDDILRVLLLTLPIWNFTQFYHALTSRELCFRRIAVVEASSLMLGNAAVSLICAFLGFGVWSLVIGRICFALMRLAGFGHGRWRQAKPRWSFTAARGIIGYTLAVSVTRVATVSNQQIDRLVLARFMDATAVGLYSRARSFVALFQNVFSQPALMVLFPILSKMREEPDKLHAGYLRALAIAGVVGIPGAAGVSILAAPLVAILLGPQWGESVPILRILAIAIMLSMLDAMTDTLLRSIAKMRERAAIRLTSAICVVIAAASLAPYGLQAVAAAVVAVQAVDLVAMLFLQSRKFSVSIFSAFSAMRTGAILGFCMILLWSMQEYVIHMSTDTFSGAGLFIVATGLIFLLLFFAAPRFFLGKHLIWVRPIVSTYLTQARRQILKR